MKFYVVGIDDNSSPSLGARVMSIIACSKVFTGGARHYEIVKHLLPPNHKWINITPPMSSLFEQYSQHSSIVAFASGDPLFYGFASTIQRLCPKAQIEVFSHFNSLQQLAHTALIPYHNMHTVSLTGRNWHMFDQSLIRGESMIGILTDNSKHTPRLIAQRMVDYGYTNYTITVGELLGNQHKERVQTLTVAEVASKDFSYPNNMILQKTKDRLQPFGIADSEFMHLDGREKMITKKAIRLASLSELNLAQSSVMWDIGFCTGSVSIEAKLRFAHLVVHSFEVRHECQEIIDYNTKKFGAVGINSHIGDFLTQDISALPVPDAVFIGGHGGKLSQIVKKCSSIMNPKAVIVFNSVTLDSHDAFLEAIKENSLTLESSYQIKVDDYNSITIIKAVK